MKTTLAHQLASYASSFRFEDLSKEVVHEVKRRVIDSLGCALGAWNEEPCIIARNVASDFSAKHGSTIVGTNHKAPPDWTAFANGCCIRYFDYNDTYLSKEPAHPSDNISAALSVAESVGASGRELIAAIALAYEVQCRLCDAASIRARGWDHVTYGAFSTALACARLMKLDPQKTRHAVNIAGVACAAMRQSRAGELSHWKGVAFADAARRGVYSALLARSGMTGPAPIFEGQMAFEKQLGVSLANVGEKFKGERFSHPNVWKFLENVKVERNSELSSMYPGAVANIVHVDLADGRRLTRRVDYPLGHAKNRLKDSEVEEKFRVLVEPMLGNDRAGKIIDVAWKLDEAANVDELMKALVMQEK